MLLICNVCKGEVTPTQASTPSLGKTWGRLADCNPYLEELGAGRNLSGASPLAVAVGHAVPVLHPYRQAFCSVVCVLRA